MELLSEKIETDWLLKHCLAAEAVIRTLAVKLGRDQDLWGLVGLLHDLGVARKDILVTGFTRHSHPA